jgi:hypothetical protein
MTAPFVIFAGLAKSNNEDQIIRDHVSTGKTAKAVCANWFVFLYNSNCALAGLFSPFANNRNSNIQFTHAEATVFFPRQRSNCIRLRRCANNLLHLHITIGFSSETPRIASVCPNRDHGGILNTRNRPRFFFKHYIFNPPRVPKLDGEPHFDSNTRRHGGLYPRNNRKVGGWIEL